MGREGFLLPALWSSAAAPHPQSREALLSSGTHSRHSPYQHLFLGSVGAAFLQAQTQGGVDDQGHTLHWYSGHVAATQGLWGRGEMVKADY